MPETLFSWHILNLEEKFYMLIVSFKFVLIVGQTLKIERVEKNDFVNIFLPIFFLK